MFHYWFRLFYTMLVALYRRLFDRRLSQQRGIGDVHVTHWRCWPFDLDEYLHMNNCSYFTFAEMGRRELFFSFVNKDPKLTKQMMTCVAAGHWMRFRKSIAPFQAFRLETQIVGTKERSFWFEQRFVDSSNFVLAHTICRMTLTDKTALVYKCFNMEKELPLPAHVELFMKTDEASSELLKQ